MFERIGFIIIIIIIIIPEFHRDASLERNFRAGLFLLIPCSATVIATKYELHGFVVSLLISSDYLARRKELSCTKDSLSADCSLSELCFPSKFCPVIENEHSTSLAPLAQC